MKAALGGRDVGSEVALETRISEGGGEGRRDGSASYRRLFPATKLKTRPGRREGRGGVNTASQDNGLSGAQAMGHTNTLDDREGGAGLLRVAVKYRNREDGIYRTPNSGKYRTVMTVSTTLALGNNIPRASPNEKTGGPRALPRRGRRAWPAHRPLLPSCSGTPCTHYPPLPRGTLGSGHPSGQ